MFEVIIKVFLCHVFVVGVAVSHVSSMGSLLPLGVPAGHRIEATKHLERPERSIAFLNINSFISLVPDTTEHF